DVLAARGCPDAVVDAAPGGVDGAGGPDLHRRLVAALDLVAGIERQEPSLPQRGTGRELLARDRVVRTARLDPRAAPMVPRELRGDWAADDPAVRPVQAPVATDVVV